MTLAAVWEPLIGAVEVTVLDGYHLAYGPTERTAESGCDHVVVARAGVTVWDPHPSRAGLTRVKTLGVLVPWPDAWDLDKSADLNPCVCPACSAPPDPHREDT